VTLTGDYSIPKKAYNKSNSGIEPKQLKRDPNYAFIIYKKGKSEVKTHLNG
jgi:hypothetical protein